MEALLGQSDLRRVRSFVGDPACIDGRREDAIGLEHLQRTGARQHVERSLRHVGVGVTWSLVAATELASIADTLTT